MAVNNPNDRGEEELLAPLDYVHGIMSLLAPPSFTELLHKELGDLSTGLESDLDTVLREARILVGDAGGFDRDLDK